MPESARALVTVHAIAAVVATLAALAAAVLLFMRRDRFPLAAHLAALALVVAFATGMRLDAPFRNFARQRLFVASSALGWLFERKLHASVAAVALAVVASSAIAASALLAPAARDARRAAHLAAVAAAAFALFATAVSFVVAPHLGFR